MTLCMIVFSAYTCYSSIASYIVTIASYLHFSRMIIIIQRVKEYQLAIQLTVLAIAMIIEAKCQLAIQLRICSNYCSLHVKSYSQLYNYSYVASCFSGGYTIYIQLANYKTIQNLKIAAYIKYCAIFSYKICSNSFSQYSHSC